ncbi:MAG: hypothetical protein WC471_03270 [Candidatus Woesearchaeota archaeon]
MMSVVAWQVRKCPACKRTLIVEADDLYIKTDCLIHFHCACGKELGGIERWQVGEMIFQRLLEVYGKDRRKNPSLPYHFPPDLNMFNQGDD